MLLALATNWSLELDAWFNYIKVDNLDEATHIKIDTTPNNGAGAIVELNRDTYADEVQLSFSFQKRRFLYHLENGTFTPPKYQIDQEPLLGDYQSSKGLSGDLSKKYRLYGKNFFDIPIPSFTELFKEHATAPFFVFQIFCVGLWLLDDSWYYSLFTLFMLVSFECTTVFQRRTTMGEFRTMGVKPFDIYTYRDNKWIKIETKELLPGDLVSITRTGDEFAIPCDLILTDGSAIVNEAMLSGESTPLLKESIKLRPSEEKIQLDGLDKNSILHGGTKVLQVTTPTDPIVPVAPDNGALAIVTKTGFETSQGSLVRVMIFSAERISVGNYESLFFILFLLIFAIAASWFVWVEGTKMGRIQNKLILDCIIIITSVVPPELPMELTMAVNTSLASLSKFYIYCTEPFRIPLAGRVDVCCFDKTGTLTGEDLVFEGLAGFSKNSDEIRHLAKPSEAPEITNLVLGSAHALVKLDDGEVVGDPMEKATLEAVGWEVEDKDVVTRSIESSKKKEKIRILRRFQFSSQLKRSSSISAIGSKTLVSVKGAPETIHQRIIDAPANYEEIYQSFTRSGSRVLALAYKHLEDNISPSKVTKIKREDIEKDLKFAGFIVFHCPLKDDAIETIEMLNESSHRCVMITGDNPLTAVHVAKEVKIVEREVLILDSPEERHGVKHELIWKSVDESILTPFNPSEPIDEEIFKTHDIAVTGYALAKLTDHSQLKSLIRHTWVYARVSPAQKEFILLTLKNMGYNTLMCGDGTNDVGALKQAHVGVALLNGTEEGMKKIIEAKKIETLQQVYTKQCDLMTRFNKPNPKVPLPIAHLYPPGPNNPNYLKAIEKQGIEITEEMKELAKKASESSAVSSEKEQNEAQSDLAGQLLGSLNQLEEDSEAPTLKLGDASVAAPFTSKLSNVSTVTNIIREGRCALVSTIQMYKILALNCLISAYSLSVIYLAGVKFGDGQATTSGILISICFLSISRGKPIQKLSKERPQPGIFNIYIMGSILGQFAIHIISLIYITREIYLLEPREPQIDLEKEFSPSLLNTGIFLIQLVQQISTFAVNYQGKPFRESITDNKGMYYGILGVAALAFSGATEFIPELNEAMKFVPMTTEFKIKLTTSMILDLVLTWLIENVLKYFFMDFKASDIAER